MLKWFLINGEKVPVQEAIDSRAYIDRYPTAYLRLCAEQREWKGKASVTQLLNGTRQAYLKLLVDFAEDPDDQSFRVHGTLSHEDLESFGGQVREITETRLEGIQITGITDMVELDGKKKLVLTDYKRSGSFAVARWMGATKRQRAMIGRDGQAVLYQRSGKGYTKGQPKQEVFYEFLLENRDAFEIDMQLNMYRILFEASYDVKIDRMRAFAIIRDGGTQVAKNRGMVRNTYPIPIPRLEDGYVLEYFATKRDALLAHLQGHQLSIDAGHDAGKAVMDNMPTACNEKEAWKGRRCQGYCPVAEVCAKAGNPYVGPTEEVGSE